MAAPAQAEQPSILAGRHRFRCLNVPTRLWSLPTLEKQIPIIYHEITLGHYLMFLRLTKQLKTGRSDWTKENYDNKQYEQYPTSSSAPGDARENLSSVPRCRRNGEVASTERVHRQDASLRR
jgi:hypothetical protein